jgi:hypothetical protein
MLVIDLQEAPDGSIIGCGLGLSGLDGVMREGFHFRLDANGTFMWVRRWASSNVYVKNIKAISASEYILFACDFNTSASSNADIITARVDAATGELNWVSPRMDLYNTVPYIDDICGVTELGGAYYMTGRVFTNGSPLSTCRVSVTRFGGDGQHQWTRYLMYSNTLSRRMYGADIIATNDSLTVFWMGDITGATSNFRLGVTRLDANGNIAWSRAYDVGNSALELADRIVATDYGYAMTAQYSVGAEKRVLIMGIDHSGNLLWTRTHGPQGQPHAPRWQYQKNLIVVGDGLMYTAGAPGSGGSDLLLVRTDIDGSLECEATGNLPVTTSVLPTATFTSPYGATSANFTLTNTSVQPTNTFLPSDCDAIVVDLGPDVEECGSILLDATTAGASYLWQDGSTNAVLLASSTGTYWVQVTVDCCVLSDTVNVQLGSNVTSVDLGPDLILCPENTYTLSVDTQGQTVLWSTGSTGSSITVAVPGQYWVRVGDGECAVSDTIMVNAGDVPQISIGGAATLDCVSTCVQLAVEGLPEGGTVQWNTGASSEVLEVCDPGFYNVLVSSGIDGCTATAEVTIEQNNLAPNFTVGDAVLPCEGGCVDLVAMALSGIEFVWSGPDGGSGSQANFQACLPGQYSVLGTNPENGCTREVTAVVTLSQDIVDLNVTDGVLTCLEPCVVLTASSNDNGVSFAWRGPTGDGDGPTFQACVPGTYAVVATSGNQCAATQTIQVIGLFEGPAISAEGGTLDCNTSSVSLVSTGIGTFAWTGPDNFVSPEQSPTVSVPGIYNLVVTGENGCQSSASVEVVLDNDLPGAVAAGGTLNCLTNSVTLNAAGNGSFAWTGPDGFNSNEQDPSVSLAGVYELVVTGSNGCQSIASAEVLQDVELPGATAMGAVLSCEGGSIMLLGDGNGSFSWSGPNGFTSDQQNPLVSTPGTYVLVVTGLNGCTSQATALVFEDECDECPPLIISCSADVTIECGMSDHPLDVGAPIFRKVLTCPEVSVGWTDQWFGNCPWTLVRTWTANDETGAVEVCIQTITVVDTQGPSFMCDKPADIIVNCSNIPAPIECVAMDECDGVLNVTMTETKTGDGCNEDYSIVRNYVATDACGNDSNFEHVIQVVNGQPDAIFGGTLRERVKVNVAPNPFRQETRIRFEAPEAGMVAVEITDLQGRLVTELYQARVEVGQEVSVFFRPERNGSGLFLYTITLNGSEMRGRLVHQP